VRCELHYGSPGKEFFGISNCRANASEKSSIYLGLPIAMITQRGPYVLLLFLFFFSARSPRSLGGSPRNFATWSEEGAILKTRSKIWDPPLKKNLGPNTCFFPRDFGQLCTSIANIFGVEQDIDNRKTELQTTISLAPADVIWWTLVHKQQKIGP